MTSEAEHVGPLSDQRVRVDGLEVARLVSGTSPDAGMDREAAALLPQSRVVGVRAALTGGVCHGFGGVLGEVAGDPLDMLGGEARRVVVGAVPGPSCWPNRSSRAGDPGAAEGAV